MWTVTNVTKQKASFQLAKQFRDMEPCPHDRPLNATRLRELERRFDNQEFRSVLWAKAYCDETKTWYRVNGKHTSTMIADFNGKLNKTNPIHVIVEEYSCPTMEDVARLYSSFDSRISARSTSDINRIFSAVNPELVGISARTVNMCVSAFHFADYEDSYGQTSAEDKASKMLEYPGFVRWVANLINGHDASHIARVPSIAAAFKCWLKSQKDATDFWQAVRDGSGTEVKSPDRVLNKYLLRTSCSYGRGTNTGKQSASRREMYVKCIHAWNAWRTGAPTDLKFYPKADTPAAK